MTDRSREPHKTVVLYIDDYVADRELFRHAMRHEDDIELIIVSGGAVGVATARTFKPDIIFVDLHMPDMNGNEVLQQLRRDRRTRDLPVVMLSAEFDPDRIIDLRTAGAVDYLVKPLDYANLPRLVRDMVKRHVTNV